ncbi:MAG: AMP-binding protein [Chloroflexi bacterium]|nr:AMP-binding protein [Chloroflexota bacterium]
MTYEAVYGRWQTDPVTFWAQAAEDVQWYEKWSQILDDSNPPFYRWFAGGVVNSCYNALDWHVANGRADQLALIYDSPVTDTIKKYTYAQLQDEVAKLAGILTSLDVQKGEHLQKYDLSHFKALFLAGERCDPATLLWAEEKLGIPVIDHWWQTETGWPVCSNMLGIELLPFKPGSAARPVPGYDVCVLDITGEEMAPDEIGDIVVKLPLLPGCLPTLWQDDGRFIESYLRAYEGYYLTADAGFIDEYGYLSIMSRTDDIINVAGHRLSTGGMEEVLAAHPDVAECAVIGVQDDLKGETPLGLAVLNAGVTRDHDDIINELIMSVREQIGPVASFKVAAVVERLPKTRSGKILRGTIKKVADNSAYQISATIDDPTILEEISAALAKIGYGVGRE